MTKEQRQANLLEAHSDSAASDEEDGVEEEPEITAYIEIELPPKQQRTARRGAKAVEQAPLTAGPINMRFSAKFRDLLNEVAIAIRVAQPRFYNGDVTLLATETFQYRLVKPATSKALPLRDDAGLKAMKRELEKKNQAVIIRMSPPHPPPAQSAVCERVYLCICWC
jgi:hypothetical protein